MIGKIANVFKQRTRGLLAMVLISGLLSGCGAASSSTDKPDADPSIPSGATPYRIVAGSMATAEICDRLRLDLVGIVHSDRDQRPARYHGIAEIGMPMNPDQEKLMATRPDWVLAPVSLRKDLTPTYDKLHLNYAFINLNNIPGMMKSIDDLGMLFDRREEAAAMHQEYQAFMKDFKARRQGKSRPKVLLLMGLPGSYVAATDRSYAGSLIKLAGAENVYSGEQAFIKVNVEDMLKKDPDLILRTAHALPDQVMKMFAKDFQENPNWRHFRAVKNQRVYDLDAHRFGMSANFQYPEALHDLEVIFDDEKGTAAA